MFFMLASPVTYQVGLINTLLGKPRDLLISIIASIWFIMKDTSISIRPSREKNKLKSGEGRKRKF